MICRGFTAGFRGEESHEVEREIAGKEKRVFIESRATATRILQKFFDLKIKNLFCFVLGKPPQGGFGGVN